MSELKILILSDLNWRPESKGINRKDILDLMDSGGVIPFSTRFLSVRKYWEIVEREEPDLILLAGDVTGDGSCGYGFHTAFFYLLTCIQLRDTRTFFIQGDNDLPDYYQNVLDNIDILPSITEISGKIGTFKGLKILGVPFHIAHKKRDLISVLKEVKGTEIDLVLGHIPLKRRTFLMEMSYKCFITGHFDNKLFPFQDKVFLSCSNDSSLLNYAVIEKSAEEYVYTYRFFYPPKDFLVSYSLMADRSEKLDLNGIPVAMSHFELPEQPYKSAEWQEDLIHAVRFLRGQEYKDSLAYMLNLKKEDLTPSKKELKAKMKNRVTAKHTLSRSMLIDFLGDRVRPILFS